ncbi:MAG: zinc ribbon domain-containing protein, partial [Candidatus Bipolaricaulia bacterium]
AVINVGAEDAEQLKTVKSEREGKKVIGQKRWESLKAKALPESKTIKRLRNQLKRHHKKTADSRKRFWDRLSSWLMRNYEVFICENGLQEKAIRAKSAPKYENGKAVPNQKKAKSGLNKSLADLAPGMFMAFCDRKYKEAGRKFIRYPARNSTLECFVCGQHNHMGGNYPGQDYYCSNCHYQGNRDQKAAIYIAVMAWEQGKVAFELLSEASKNAVLMRLEWQRKNQSQPKRKTKSRRKGKLKKTPQKPVKQSRDEVKSESKPNLDNPIQLSLF